MDADRFGELSKRIGAARGRRAMLLALGGGVLAAWLGRGADPVAAAEAEAEFIRLCRPANLPCNNRLDCCARRCIDGTFLGQPARVCGCNRAGANCIRGLGKACCSGRCRRNGRCR